MASEQGVELRVSLLCGLEQRARVRDLDAGVDGSGGGESMVVRREDLCPCLGLEALDERVDVDGAQEELVESLVGREQDLAELGAVRGRLLVGEKGEESSEELDLGLVGSRRRFRALFELGWGGNLLVETSSGVVEVLGEDLRGDPC